MGDRLQTDAVASHLAGMKDIWLNRKGIRAPQTADATVIQTPADLAGALNIYI